MQYIQEAKEEPDDAGCVFCSIPQTEAERVLVHGDLAYVVLNKFPYNPGHLLVVPLRHVGDLEAVTAEENAELQALLQRSLAAIRATSDPAGFNVGLNLGRIAGAGIPGTSALARRSALERRHELHARRGRDTRAPGAARGDVPPTEAGVRVMADVRTGSVDVPGGSLYYEVAGEGPAMTLIHPGLWDSRTWDPQVPVLVDAAFRVIRYDVRGYGRSSRLTGEPYSHVRDLEALLDVLEVPLTILVGCSMGGAIAIDFTLEHPGPRRRRSRPRRRDWAASRRWRRKRTGGSR